MMIFSRLFQKYRELIMYCMIGCTGAALDFIIFTLLSSYAGLHYQFANFLSVSFGIINNFFLNQRFNFKIKDHILRRLGSFYAVGMFGCLLSAGALWLLIEQLCFNKLVSKIATIFLVTVVQFVLNKCITFRKGNRI